MYFDSFSSFIEMGGHGPYVWMSYGFFLLIVLWNLYSLWAGRKNALGNARKTWAREPRYSRNTGDSNGSDKANSAGGQL